MNREKKFFQKRRRAVNSVWSWLLVFAMIISSVPAAPGAAITAFAAGNETGEGAIAHPAESAAKDDDGMEHAGDITDTSTEDGGTGDSGDGSGAEQEPDDPGSQPDADTEHGNGGTETGDSTAADPDTNDDRNPDESTGTDTGDDVTVEEEDESGDTTDEGGEAADEEDGEPDDGGTVHIFDNGERIGEVEITLHFYNALDWNPVTIHYFGNGVELIIRVKKAASPRGEALASRSTPRYCPLPA